MRQLTDFGDERQRAFCAHCGGATETRDHVPSKVLLDQPYPDNLPIVLSCGACNQSFSSDEVYVACLIDCIVAGDPTPGPAHRPKVREILSQKPALAARLAAARFGQGSATRFEVELSRVRNVVLKLAKGHALYELNCPQHDDPAKIDISPIQDMDESSREHFERPPALTLWPEAGSRAMQRLAESYAHEWVVVQPGRYRYLAYVARVVTVRIVLSEYLACEVGWADVWPAPRPSARRPTNGCM